MNKNFSKPNFINDDRFVLYKNARIIDPESRLDIDSGILITKGDTIYYVGKDNNDLNYDEVIDCKGNILIPGLIDIQVHFREPGQEHKETIETGSMSAVSGGVTSVVCQPNTNPVIDSIIVLNHLKQRIIDTAYNNVFVYPAITIGMKGTALTDIESLAEHDLVVGFTDDGLPVNNSLLMRRALEISKKINMPIAQHAQDLDLTNSGCMNEGNTSFNLGLKGMPNVEEAIVVDRDIHLVTLTDGYYHVLHVSTAQSLESLVRAKNRGINVTFEVTPHHFTLTDECIINLGAMAKMNPPLRSENDRKAIINAISEGYVDCITTDHAPHEADVKNVPMQDAAFGIVGLETLLPLSLELYFKHNISLLDILGLLTYKPANIIRKNNIGRLKPGCKADITIFDIDKLWTIDISNFNSKSKNSPFDGREVRGKVMRTVVSGNTVFELI